MEWITEESSYNTRYSRRAVRKEDLNCRERFFSIFYEEYACVYVHTYINQTFIFFTFVSITFFFPLLLLYHVTQH